MTKVCGLLIGCCERYLALLAVLAGVSLWLPKETARNIAS